MVYVSYALSREATLDARRRLLAQCPRLIEELAEVTTNLERQTQRLLPGGTAALAARIVKEVAAAANVDVRSDRLLPPIELTGLQVVPIELTVAGSIRDPVELLSKIEQTSRLLAVKDRKVRVAAVGQPREVLITLTVAGYLLPANGNNP
jgi:general secretion pathway protein M